MRLAQIADYDRRKELRSRLRYAPQFKALREIQRKMSEQLDQALMRRRPQYYGSERYAEH